jgi:soluble lytic murein transglycosylase
MAAKPEDTFGMTFSTTRPLWLTACLLAVFLFITSCSSIPFFQTGPTSTPRPSPTSTRPAPTPTPFPTPTPLPTPTPVPAVRITSGDKALSYGDWELALKEYSEAAAGSPDPEIQAAAALGIGRVHYYLGDYIKALTSLRKVVEYYPNSYHAGAAYFFLAQTYNTLTRYEEAAQSYDFYIQSKPDLIDAYIYELQGDVYVASGDLEEAMTSYLAAINSPKTGDRIPLQIKTAGIYAQSGDYQTALLMYEDIYQRADNDFTKAQLALLIGQTYMTLGQPEPAYAIYQDAVRSYPLAYDTYLALVALVQAGQRVNELDRGLVNYFARQYNLSIAALDRYLSSEPESPDTAHYYKGLNLRALGNHYGAIEQFEIVIEQYTGSNHWANAWEQKANTFINQLDNRSAGRQVLLDFAETAYWHSKAPELLYRAARDFEIEGDLDTAAVLWERVADDFPYYDNAFRAMFLAGISRYRQDEFGEALDIFQRSVEHAQSAYFRAAAYMWIGKAHQALGDALGAEAAWREAAGIDPVGYYSERSRDLLLGREPFTPPAKIYLSLDREAEKREAEEWIRTTFLLPSVIDLSRPGPLLSDPRTIRGTELWRLGLLEEARLEFEDLRLSVEDDAANTYRLANYLIDFGLYRPGIFAARRVLTLAGMDDAATINAPAYFNRLRYGTYYLDLIVPEAEKYDFHPFFVLSLIRQESLFESWIGSSAGARGLMQFMPATGQERAERMGWPPDYTVDDLYRPVVSIVFGLNYLDFNRTYLDGDLYATLAGYNAGPGNSRAWKNIAPDDPDLFLEIVRFEETHRYIRVIYEMFTIYSKLYSRLP